MPSNHGWLRPTAKPPARGAVESMERVPAVEDTRSRSRSPDPGGPRPGFAAGSAATSDPEAGARRLRAAGVGTAQFFLVVDLLLPLGWDRRRRVEHFSHERSISALQQACNAAVTLGAVLDRMERAAEGTPCPPSPDAPV